ncbi:hypothetical protein IMSAGC008_00749 [Muribaculaceae bacterium]|nr:hypothetical protein IMSAGC008_00749 [Muribaculaceae bacterium]
MVLGRRAFDSFVGEFGEHIFEGILAGVGNLEAYFLGGFAHSEKASVDNGRVERELGRVGGRALNDDTDGVAVNVGKDYAAGLAARSLGCEGKFKLYFGTCREAGIDTVGRTLKVFGSRRDIGAVQAGAILAASEGAVAAVEHFYLECLCLSYKNRAEVNDFRSNDIRLVSAHSVCEWYGEVLSFVSAFVGSESYNGVVCAVDKLGSVGRHCHFLSLTFAESAAGRSHLYDAAPVGVGRTGGYGPCHFFSICLIRAAAECFGKLCPCLAVVVAHKAVGSRSSDICFSHTQRIAFLVAVKVDCYPESLAGSEIQLFGEGYGVSICEIGDIHVGYKRCLGDCKVAAINLNLGIHAIVSVNFDFCEVESVGVCFGIYIEPLCHRVRQGPVRIADIGIDLVIVGYFHGIFRSVVIGRHGRHRHYAITGHLAAVRTGMSYHRTNHRRGSHRECALPRAPVENTVVVIAYGELCRGFGCGCGAGHSKLGLVDCHVGTGIGGHFLDFRQFRSLAPAVHGLDCHIVLCERVQVANLVLHGVTAVVELGVGHACGESGEVAVGREGFFAVIYNVVMHIVVVRCRNCPVDDDIILSRVDSVFTYRFRGRAVAQGKSLGRVDIARTELAPH